MAWGYNPKNYDQAFTNLKDIKAVRSIINKPAKHALSTSIVTVRNLVLFDMGIFTGMQLDDLLNLHVRDFHGGFVKIKYAPGCSATRVLSLELCRELDDYISGADLGDDAWLFPSMRYRGQHLQPIYVYRLLRDVGNKCGITNLGDNSLRKTFGRMWYEQNRPFRVLRVFYNQQSVSDTLDYIGIDPDILSSTDPDYIIDVLKHVDVSLPISTKSDIKHICFANSSVSVREVDRELAVFDPLN